MGCSGLHQQQVWENRGQLGWQNKQQQLVRVIGVWRDLRESLAGILGGIHNPY
jgi:hypothetical protein